MGDGRWGAIHQSPCHGHAHKNRSTSKRGNIQAFPVFGNVQNHVYLLICSLPPDPPPPKSYVSINKKIWLCFVFHAKPQSELSGQSKRPGGLLDALDDIQEGCMASAGKTAVNIGIIKSDLHAIIACAAAKRGHQEAGGPYDRGSILPERG